jgi:ABC-type lipoprotein export system ATPase subunit
MTSPILQIENVTKTYRRRGRETVEALRGVSLALEPGVIQVVSGPSGSGKSTLLLCAGGLLQPDSGTVMFGKRNLYGLSSEERAGFRAQSVGFVFQQFHLVPFLNVLDNVQISALTGVRDGDFRRRALVLIERFGLLHRLTHPTVELSVGERQRVALARALFNEPKLLLADEPTGNLDEENGRLVMDALLDFTKTGGSVLVVTHDRRIEFGNPVRLENGVFVSASSCEFERERGIG